MFRVGRFLPLDEVFIWKKLSWLCCDPAMNERDCAWPVRDEKCRGSNINATTNLWLSSSDLVYCPVLFTISSRLSYKQALNSFDLFIKMGWWWTGETDLSWIIYLQFLTTPGSLSLLIVKYLLPFLLIKLSTFQPQTKFTGVT